MVCNSTRASGGGSAGPGDPRTLIGALKEAARWEPAARALLGWDADGVEHPMTYGELVQRVESVAAGLVAIGVRPAERVALLMTNRVEWPVIFFAAMRIGAVVVPVSTFFKGADLTYVLSRSRAQHLVVLDRVGERDFVSLVEDCFPRIRSQLRSPIRVPELPELRNIVVVQRDRSNRPDLPWLTLEDVEEMGRGAAGVTLAAELEASVTPDHLAMIKYTSGSTGFPKGAMLRQGPILETERAVRERLAITHADVYCSTAPMFHLSGSAWGFLTILVGGGLFVFPELADPQQTVELMEREKCTIRFGFPPSYLKELEVEGVSSRTYRLRALCGRPPSLVEEYLRPVYKFELAFSPYGLTEAYGPVTVQPPGCPREIQAGHTCGTPLAGQELVILDPVDGRSMGPAETGEICLRGRVMDGYWDDQEATDKAIDRGGWLHTGDLGWLDGEGNLHFVGRSKTRLRVGGENVSVEEIERLVAEVAGVRGVVVVAIDDEVYGQLPYAFVQGDGRTTPEAVTAYCRNRAAWFKVPHDVELVDGFPLLGNGKPDRLELAKRAHTTIELRAQRRQ